MENAAPKTDKGIGPDLQQEIQNLMEENNLNMCLDCGKCSAVCPMVDFYGEFVYSRSSRSLVERVCFDQEGIRDEALWYCLSCRECTFFCPSGIDFQKFVMGLRDLLISHGHREYAHFCSQCGSYLMPVRQLKNLEKGLNEKRAALFYECPNCKKSKQVEMRLKLSRKGRYLVHKTPANTNTTRSLV